MLKTFSISERKTNFLIYGIRLLLILMPIQDEHGMIIRCYKTMHLKKTRHNGMNKDETRRLFYSTLDQVINEVDLRFSHQNTKLYPTVSALQPESSNFLDVKMVHSLGFGRPCKYGNRI